MEQTWGVFVCGASPMPRQRICCHLSGRRIAVGSVIHTDGWLGYLPVEHSGYPHRVTFLKGRKESASELLPRVHLVASLLKRWLLGTHQGAISREHLDYYLDEFTFRFNRRNSRSRGKLFLRLAEQAVAVAPVTNRW